MINWSYFTNTTARLDADILKYIIKDNMIFTDDKHGTRGSIEYEINYVLATKVLEVNPGVSIHFIPTVTDDGTGSENTCYKYIQSMFCGNMNK